MQQGNELVILKRREKKEPWGFNLGCDYEDVFERVVINREDKTVAIETFNRNKWYKEPFVARRDFFTPLDTEPNHLFLI